MGKDTLDIYELKSLEDLGRYLSYERKKRGIEIEDIQRETKIRTRYIHAIERGEFSTIPGGNVYVRGFLKNYTEGIGLNSQQILEQYKNISRAVSEDQNEVSEEEHGENESQMPALITGQGIKIAIIAVIALVAILLVVKFTRTPKKDEVNPKQERVSQIDASKLAGELTEEPKTDDEIDEATPVTVEVVEETQEKTTYSIKAERIKVNIRALSRCWISTQIDGNSDFEGILSNGDTKSFEAGKDLIIRMGNPSMVELVVNEVDIGVPGGNARDFIFMKK